MEVQVFDGLTRTVAAVVDDSEAVLEIELLGYLRRRLEHFGDDRAVLRGYLGSALYVLLRDNENMERSLRLEVIERENIVVLIDFFEGISPLIILQKYSHPFSENLRIALLVPPAGKDRRSYDFILTWR